MCSASFINKFSTVFSRIFFVLLISFFSMCSFAEAATKITADQVTCGKDLGLSLAEFKAKLVSNCDLSKPFSSSLSHVLNEDTFFYCCQKAN